MNKILINVQKMKVDADPPVDIFSVVIETIEQPQTSEWRETFVNEGELRAFFRGIKSGSAMLHNTYAVGGPEITFHPQSIIQLL